MNTKMLTMILAAVLVGCFFLPYWSIMGYDISGFDAVKGSGGTWEKYTLLLIPVSGLLLLIGAANNGNYPLGRNLLCWLPLLTVLFWIIGVPLIHGTSFGDIFKAIGKGYGIGWWITIGVSLILALYNPRK